MVPLNELKFTASKITVRDGDEAPVSVLVERRREGRLKVDCPCEWFAKRTWCPHVLHVLCGRGQFADLDQENAVFDIIDGTPLQERGVDLDEEFDRFNKAITEMSETLARGLEFETLDKLAMALHEGADAIDEFQRAADAFVRMARSK